MSESEAKGQRPGGKGQGAEAGVAEATVSAGSFTRCTLANIFPDNKWHSGNAKQKTGNSKWQF